MTQSTRQSVSNSKYTSKIKHYNNANTTFSLHIDEYLEMSGKTCWSSNDECVEAVHQLLERRNLRHGLKKTKNLIGS